MWNRLQYTHKRPVSCCSLEALELDLCSFFSLFPKSYRMGQVSDTWWPSDLTAPLAGCRQRCHQPRPQDTCLRMRASSPFPPSRWRWESTTTKERGLLDPSPPSTLQRKVCHAHSKQQRNSLVKCIDNFRAIIVFIFHYIYQLYLLLCFNWMVSNRKEVLPGSFLGFPIQVPTRP